MKRENKILLGVAVLLAAICLGQIWIKHQEKVRTLAEQKAEQAAKEDSVVFEDGDVVSGRELWLDSYETTQAGEPASVRLVRSYSAVEPDDTHYVTREHTYYVQELTFDGEVYALADSDHAYRYLLCYPDQAAWNPSMAYTSATFYILANDENVTPQDIERYETSSVWEGEPLDACRIYTEYTWKEEYRHLHEH